MQSAKYTIGLAVLCGGAAIAWAAAGCSLDGLVFDIPADQAAGGGSSVSSGTSSQATSASSDSAAGSGGSTAQTSSSTGGPPLTENCLNGVDDDSDGLADCDDPKCLNAGYSCFDPAVIPPSWSGPVIVFSGDAAMGPVCPGDYPTLVKGGAASVSGGPATCGACQCSNANITCSPTSISGYADSQCAAPGQFTYDQPVINGCSAASFPNMYSFLGGLPNASVSGCQPSGGAATVPPAVFSGSAAICSGSTAGLCSAGGACRPPAPAPFQGSLCIYHKGDANCPAGFPNKFDLVDPSAVSDSRGCSPCQCTPPNQFGCNLTYTFFGDSTCTNAVVSISANNTCHMYGFPVNAQSIFTNVGYTGTCAVQGGGQPVGGISGAIDTTVCCAP